MEELFQHLEQRIHKLVQKFEHEQSQGKQSLADEKERLLRKHQGVVTQIENMIARLKALERLQ
ncbi:MAG: hypothetical protein K0S27_708 [Gammaproteobacteria bacterium]|jgi:hypothetical protein|nr:hypothetical protein [Gammaproteobacteria bacterium]